MGFLPDERELAAQLKTNSQALAARVNANRAARAQAFATLCEIAHEFRDKALSLGLAQRYRTTYRNGLFGRTHEAQVPEGWSLPSGSLPHPFQDWVRVCPDGHLEVIEFGSSLDAVPRPLLEVDLANDWKLEQCEPLVFQRAMTEWTTALSAGAARRLTTPTP